MYHRQLSEQAIISGFRKLWKTLCCHQVGKINKTN